MFVLNVALSSGSLSTDLSPSPPQKEPLISSSRSPQAFSFYRSRSTSTPSCLLRISGVRWASHVIPYVTMSDGVLSLDACDLDDGNHVMLDICSFVKKGHVRTSAKLRLTETHWQKRASRTLTKNESRQCFHKEWTRTPSCQVRSLRFLTMNWWKSLPGHRTFRIHNLLLTTVYVSLFSIVANTIKSESNKTEVHEYAQSLWKTNTKK